MGESSPDTRTAVEPQGDTRFREWAEENRQLLNCRFYENEWPEVEECVLATVTSVTDLGAFVELPEYSNKEALVLISESGRRRFRSNPYHVGGKFAGCVLRVDTERGYIDLSRRRVTEDDKERLRDRYFMSKIVRKILERLLYCIIRPTKSVIALLCGQHPRCGASSPIFELPLLVMHLIASFMGQSGITLLHIYQRHVWPLNTIYKNPFLAFQRAIIDPAAAFKGVEIPSSTLNSLSLILAENKRLFSSMVEMDIDVTCFGPTGIDGLKEIFLAGESCSIPAATVRIHIISSPTYRMISYSPDIELAKATLQRAVDVMQSKIYNYTQSNLEIRSKPRVTIIPPRLYDETINFLD